MRLVHTFAAVQRTKCRSAAFTLSIGNVASTYDV
jgi:hypothetical protein